MAKRAVRRPAVKKGPIVRTAKRRGPRRETRQPNHADVEPVAAVEPPQDAAAWASAAMRLYSEWAGIVLGRSTREISAKDPRFSDPAWRDHPLYRRLGQAYLAFCDAADAVAGDSKDWRKRERAKFLSSILTSSLAPTNTLLGNPAALKRAFETGGRSLLAGLQNMAGDLVSNKGMPSQVDKSAFTVGRNLAVTPGAVVFRNEMVELLQYQPTTPDVCERPTLMIVPTIGKYYFMDLAPGRSFVEYAVSQGVPMFVTSWRNPGPEHAGWGLDDYVQTCLDLVGVVCEITGSDKVNLLGMCAGGIISTLMLCVMAARGDTRIDSATFGVMLLDFETAAPIGAFNARPLLAQARRRSKSKGILPASDLSSVFAWMRPNDLVWNYWVNNYLMGKAPPAFDILAWSVDGTNLPARLHEQFLDIFEHNLIAKPWDADGARRSYRSRYRASRHIDHRCLDGPPHAVERLLSEHPAARRIEHLRAEQLGTHRESGESAGKSEGKLLARSEARAGP